MPSNITVSITAEQADLQAKLALAQANLRAFSKETRDAAEAMRAAGAGASNELRAGLETAAASMAQAKANIAALKSEASGSSSLFTELKEGFESLKGFGELTIAGLSLRELYEGIVGAAEGAAKLDMEVLKLSITMGSSVQQAAALDGALKIIGSSSEEYGGMLFKLERQIKTNETAINQLGIATRDAAGNLLPATQLMENAVKGLEAFKEGTDRNQASLYLFGRGAQQAFSIFLLNKGVIKQAADDIRDLGGPTERSIQQSEEFEKAWNRLGNQFALASATVGRDLQPSLTDLAKVVGADLKLAFAQLEPLIRGVIAAFDTLGTAAAASGAIMMEAILAPRVLADTVKNMFTEGFGPALDGALKHYSDVLKGFEERGVAYVARMKALFGSGGDVEPIVPKGSKTFTTPDTGKGTTEAQADLKFEQEKLEIARQYESVIQSAASVNSAYYTRLAADARLAAEQGKITNQEELAQLITLEDEKYALAARGLNERLKIEQEFGVNETKLLDERKIAYEQHVAAIDALTGRQIQEQTKAYDQAAKSWQQALRPFTSSFEQGILGMIRGTETFRQAVANMANAVVTSFVQMEVQTAARWAAKELAQTFSTQGGVAARTAAENAGNVSLLGQMGKALAQWLGLETDKTGATEAGVAARTAAETGGSAIASAMAIARGMAAISVSAAEAAAAAFADSAMLGPPGLAAAPGVAAAAYAATMGWAAGMGVASLDVGTMNVPHDMLAMIHQGEIVVPESFSSALRQGQATLGGSNGAGAAGGSTNNNISVTFHVHTPDAGATAAWLNANARTVAHSVSRYISQNPQKL